MSKKELQPAAERMYTVEQYTIEAIAQELGIAERTVRNWKTECAWDAKRQRLIDARTSTHEDLYGMARKLIQVINIDLDAMISATDYEDPDDIENRKASEQRDRRIESRINAMSRLLDKLPKTKQYEVTQKAEAEAGNKKEVTGDQISARVAEILGG